MNASSVGLVWYSTVWTEIRATRLSRITKELQRDGRVGVSVDGNFVVLIHKQLL